MQLFEESVILQNKRLERQQSLQKNHLKDLSDFAEEHSVDPATLVPLDRESLRRSSLRSDQSRHTNSLEASSS